MAMVSFPSMKANRESEGYYSTEDPRHEDQATRKRPKSEEEVKVMIEELERELRILRGTTRPSDFGDPFEDY